MNKKLLLAVFFTATITITSVSVAVASSNIRSIQASINSQLKITLNDAAFEPKEADGTPIEPIVYNGRTYLSVRAMADLMGLEISFDKETSTVKLVKPNPDEGLPVNDNLPTSGAKPEKPAGNSQREKEAEIPLNTPQFNDGVTIDTSEPSVMVVKVDKDKLPGSMKNFTKISVCGTNDLSDGTIARIINDTQVHGYGLETYNPGKGFRELAGAQYFVVMIFDDSVNPLGYYLIK